MSLQLLNIGLISQRIFLVYAPFILPLHPRSDLVQLLLISQVNLLAAHSLTHTTARLQRTLGL